MKKMLTVLVVVVAIGLLAAAAYADEATPVPTPTPTRPGPDLAAIIQDFATWSFWATLLATLIAGAVGGIVYELLILQGNLELPHKAEAEESSETYAYAITRNLFDLGIWARVIIGALAAVAALFILSPKTAFALLSSAVVAGSAGTAIFRSLQDRLAVALAQKDAAQAEAAAQAQAAKVEEALAKVNVALSGGGAPGGVQRDDAGQVVPDRAALEEARELLLEARGIGRR